MRIALIIMLMYAILYADMCSDDMKIKAKSIGNTMLVKIFIRDTNNFREVRDKKANNLRYMTHLVLKKGKNVLYNASTSDSVSSFQTIQFYVDNTNNAKNIDAIVTFNTGEQIKCSKPIKQRILEQVKLQPIPAIVKEEYAIVDYHITHPALWEATSFDEAIKRLYGTSKVTYIRNTTYTNFNPPESNNTDFFVVGCGEYIDFSVTPEVESIMLLASYKKNVVQYVIRIPDNHSFGSAISLPLSKSYSDRKLTNKLRSFTTPRSNFGSPISKLESTIAIVYRLKNGKVLRQDFKPYRPGCCGTEPNLGVMQVELGRGIKNETNF